ncbi:hypothetical protein [Streptomyces pseudovenezuelae]|uniref:hypothetical protein n=1 Tax=Streptomyces pseudovenezuelae TaxID=67350 RepID=UPI003F5FF2BD
MGLSGEVTRRAVLVAWRFSGTLAGTERRVESHGDDRAWCGWILQLAVRPGEDR